MGICLTAICGNCPDDIYGKLSGGYPWDSIWGREDVSGHCVQDICGTLSAEHLWEAVRRTNVKTGLADILLILSGRHLGETCWMTSVGNLSEHN